ncbi:MAG TPA: pyrimidine 5'-nucleotidase [Anaerolineales bacterium]
MGYTTLFIDLDGTLYPNSTGLWDAIRVRMTQYMLERLNLPKENVSNLRRQYFERYGTTLRGLQIHHGVDANDYLAFVHNLPLEKYLKAEPRLRVVLESLPQQKWIFTNADSDHARRVLAILELADCFSGIVDVRALEFQCKPEIQAYRMALDLAGEPDPQRCILIDDSPSNLAPAQEIGFTTVLVGEDQNCPAADHRISYLVELPQVVPELWSNGRIQG